MGLIFVLIISFIVGVLIGPCVPALNAFIVGVLIFIAYTIGKKEERIFAQTGRYYEKPRGS
jgi:hypothetical protein